MNTQMVTQVLNDPLAQELLHSSIPARLAYTGSDGSPRAILIGFHWNGTHFVVCTVPHAPKVPALAAHPQVALTIDTDTWRAAPPASGWLTGYRPSTWKEPGSWFQASSGKSSRRRCTAYTSRWPALQSSPAGPALDFQTRIRCTRALDGVHAAVLACGGTVPV